jgi:ubiquitin fusion degradation protein 1
MRRTNPLDIFIEVYKAFPSSFLDRDDIEHSNSIILPPSALQKLTGLQKGFGGRSNPVLFRILNIDLNISTHCGVLDFTAEEGTCYVPTNMFNRLCLVEGQNVNLRNITLERGKYIKIQPHLTAFIENPNPKTILENNLRNYFCLTEGDTINVVFNKKTYLIDIIECKPKKAISLVNCDVEVDFAPPKDYKEPEKTTPSFTHKSSGNINFDSKEKKPNNEKKIEDSKFKGRHFRIDGKQITETQINKIEAKQKIKDAEENYDPRLNRLVSKTRNKFHYVEI